MKYKDNKNVRAFTLIELIVVLVILAIIALIVTPLVMNIVKKAKDSANKRSVDAYGKAVELAVATYLLDNGEYPDTLDNLTVEYTGNEVGCNVKTLNEDGSIYLLECSVKGAEVKDSSTEDGWYHYGKTSTSAYQAYSVGDIVTYNGINFYVIEDSDETSDRVTMLKAEPLTVDEVNTYGGVGTDNNHVNMYVTSDITASNYQTAYNENGYGGMAYYSSETCGYASTDNCSNNYESSEIKYVVDAWALDKLQTVDLKVDSMGYTQRLITYEELIKNEFYYVTDSITWIDRSSNTPEWIDKYSYWTMSLDDSNKNRTYIVFANNGLGTNYCIGCPYGGVYDNYNTVRPVVTILKSAIN